MVIEENFVCVCVRVCGGWNRVGRSCVEDGRHLHSYTLRLLLVLHLSCMSLYPVLCERRIILLLMGSKI